MRSGDKYRTNTCGELTVVENHSWNNVIVSFDETGFTTTSSRNNIITGYVRDPMRKTLLGVGYIGAGKHITSKGGTPTRAYTVWRHMISRCYCPKQLSKKPTYIGCTVSGEWLSFQNFADWFYDNHIDGYHLDKDLLIEGNKLYSKETCVFVPPWLNALFTSRNAKRGEYKIGVSFCKKQRKFISTLSINGSSTRIGTHDNESDAYKNYLTTKGIYSCNKANMPDVPEKLRRQIIRKGNEFLLEAANAK